MNTEKTTEETPEKSSSWPLYLIGALLVAGFLSVLAWNIELPYLAYSVGPVSDAADSVVAEEVDVFPPDGELLMLTVVTQDVNIFEALIAGLDPTVDLVRKRAIDMTQVSPLEPLASLGPIRVRSGNKGATDHLPFL